MLTKTKIAISAAIVLGVAVSALAATKPRASHSDQSALSDVVPGYDKDGNTVAIPDPDGLAIPSRGR